MSEDREIKIEQPVGPRIYPPWDSDGFCQFSIPEYVGKTPTHSYAVSQQMLWTKSPEADNILLGHLDVPADDVGFDLRTSLTSVKTDEVRLDVSMTSLLKEEVAEGHHTVLLDFSALPGFEDPTGMNTVVYTDGGWTQIAALRQHGGINNLYESVRPGGHYGKHTILWDIIARLDSTRKRMIALMINKAFAFSSDHPDWGPGLLAGCRWTNLMPGETRNLTGGVFLLNANLTELEQRYGKARRVR